MDATLELLGLIYDAVADSSKWGLFLERFVQAVGCSRGTLALFGSTADETALVCWHGWTDDDIRSYEPYRASDPWGHAGVRLPDGVVKTTEELCTESEFLESKAYRDYYAPRNCRYGFGGMILRVGERVSAITVARPEKDGPFGEAEKAVLRPLMPHLRRAALLHGELSSLRGRLFAFTGHLDRYPHAFLLIDPNARILYANTAARELADAHDGVSIESGRFALRSVNEDRHFREIVSAVSADRTSPLRRFEAPRPFGKAPYRVLVLPVPETGAMPLGVAQPAAALLIIDPEAGHEPDPNVLRSLFSLTAAEAKIVAKLAQGRNVEEIAADTATSVETVRTHIRRVLSKTSTSRQGELIALVLRSVPFRQL